MTADVADLVAQARAGEREAWDELVARFEGLITAIARSFRLHADDAADVTQTTWLRLFESIDRVREPERLAGWIATTARRECLRVLRRAGRERPTDQLDRPDDTPAFATPGQELMAAQERDTLRAAVRALSARHRRLMAALMTSPRPSYDQVANAIDMPVGSIGPTRMRAIDQLRRDPQLMALIGMSAAR